MSVKSEWGEGSSTTKEVKDDTIGITSKMSRVSFESARHTVDLSMGLDRKLIVHKTRTTSEPNL